MIIITVASVIFCGCGKSDTLVSETPVASVHQEIVKRTEPESIKTMLDVPVADYQVPVMYSSILVNRIGYSPKETKEAVIVARALPAEFVIKDVATGEVVYTGYVKSADRENEEEMLTGICSFSDFETEGNYYIEADILGHSRDFSIKTGIYKELLLETMQKLDSLKCGGNDGHDANVAYEKDTSVTANVSGGWHTDSLGQRDVVEGCLAVLDLLTAYEYHSSAFDDKMGLECSGNKIPDILDAAKFEIDWLLKMQNSETGGVYTSVSLQTLPGKSEKQMLIGGESSRATAYFCAVLTRFSTVYAKYDSSFSSKCLKAAGKAWNCMVVNKNLVSEELFYRAAVELYRVSGSDIYNKVILDYLSKNSEKGFATRGLLDAAFTYMYTKEKTNTKYCNNLMGSYMDRTQEKTAKAGINPYGVENSNLSLKELLRNTEELVIMDYIISSRQYEQYEKDYFHYVCGRNNTSTVYVMNLSEPDECALLLVLLGRLQQKG